MTTVSLDHCYSVAKASAAPPPTGRNVESSLSSEMDSQSDGATASSSGRTSNAKRRSQRQIDKQEQEELRKIRAENEELLKKEKEDMMKKDTPEAFPEEKPSSSSPCPAPNTDATPSTPVNRAVPKSAESKTATPDSAKSNPVRRLSASGGVARPRRENRQPPKHLRDAFHQLEFEAATTGITKKLSGDPTVTPIKSSTPPDEPMDTTSVAAEEPAKKEVEEEEDSGEEDDEDPTKLWCICREPHSGRFMISCDKCNDWFHGTCVGVTKSMAKELVKKGLDWICPKCVREDFKGQLPVRFFLFLFQFLNNFERFLL